jgi:hypothetical protein
MRYPEKVLLTLEEGTLARIDAASGNRSEFIRAAVAEKLDGAAEDGGATSIYVASLRKQLADLTGEVERLRAAVPVKKPYVAPKVSSEKDWSLEHPRWGEDNAVILGALDGPKSARSLVAVLGWQEMRVDRALQRLMKGGMVTSEGGRFRRAEG